MKKLILVISIVIGFQSVFSQENVSGFSKKNEIGLNLGSTTGIGFSYRRWFGKAGMQITGIPIKTDNTEVYSLALTALYNFYDNKYLRVFGYIGNHFLYDREEGDNQPWKTITIGEDNSDNYNYYNEDSYYNKKTYSIGFGPGFAFGKTVRFNLMIGYGFYDLLDTFEMYPTGEMGIYYRF